MKRGRYLVIIFLFLTTSCLHYNYAVKRQGSPVPYPNRYSGDDENAYEFSSILYASATDFPGSGSYVELQHMTDLHEPYASLLSFSFREKDNVRLVEESVLLKHFDEDGLEIPALSKSDSLADCRQKSFCNAHVSIQYPRRLPKKILERVSFTLIINGEKKNFSYEIPLEYKYEYSFFDVMMGV